MTLTDTQIERYSRQIILPEIGGRGQEQLLGSTVALAGVGPLAEAVVPYLAGAGIGALVLRPVVGEPAVAAQRLAERAVQINPDVRAKVGASVSGAYDAAGCDVICETSGRREIVLSLVGSARSARIPIVAAGVSVTSGWLSATSAYEAEFGCGFCGWLDARQGASGEIPGPLTPTIVGAMAALVASSVIDGRLGFDRTQNPRWLRYDAETLTLEERAIVPREDCPVCGQGTEKNKCHPTLDS